MKILCSLLLLISLTSLGQEYEKCLDFDVDMKRGEYPIVIGENEEYVFVQIVMSIPYYQKKTRLYKLDKNMKILSKAIIPIQYNPKRGAAMPVDVKKFFYFNDKIIAYYTIKEKKDAVVYYDEFDSESLELKNEKIELYRYTYPKLVNARDWIYFEEFEYDGDLIFHMTIYGIAGGISAGDHKGAIVRFDENMSKRGELMYDHNQIGGAYNIVLLNNGEIAFSSLKDQTQDFYISTASQAGELNSQMLERKGKYLREYTLIPTKGDDYLFAGLYSDSEWGDKENESFQGIFIKEKSDKELAFISFAELSEDWEFSTEGYNKRNDLAIFNDYYDKETSTAYFTIYNRGKNETANLGIISYNTLTDDLRAHEVAFPAGKFSFYKIESDGKDLSVYFFLGESDKKTLVFEADISDFTKSEWVERNYKLGSGFGFVPIECTLNCESQFYLIGNGEIIGIMKSEE